MKKGFVVKPSREFVDCNLNYTRDMLIDWIGSTIMQECETYSVFIHIEIDIHRR